MKTTILVYFMALVASIAISCNLEAPAKTVTADPVPVRKDTAYFTWGYSEGVVIKINYEEKVKTPGFWSSAYEKSIKSVDVLPSKGIKTKNFSGAQFSPDILEGDSVKISQLYRRYVDTWGKDTLHDYTEVIAQQIKKH